MAEDTEATLFIVATPIGNLEDMSPRAVRVLSEVDTILCEDTRVTRVLCDHFGIRAQLLRHDVHTERQSAPGAVALLQAGRSLAYVSDAGTPAVSDPGTLLARQASDAGFRVVAVPGASAVTAAISASGLGSGAGYHFHGFAPKATKAMADTFRTLEAGLHVFFVPARDLPEACGQLARSRPTAEAAAVRELTKRHERWYRGSPERLAELIAADPHGRRGEAVLLVDLPAAAPATDEVLAAALASARTAGTSRRDAVAEVASAYSVGKKRVYQLALSLPDGRW